MSCEQNPEGMREGCRAGCHEYEEEDKDKGKSIQTNFRSPEKPTFEDVIVSPTLDDFVAGVVGDIIVFVLLEQVVRTHLVGIK